VNPEDFPSTFQIVLGAFLVETVLVQFVVFRLLAGAGADPARRESRHLRDHVVNALARAGLYGLPVAGVGTALWGVRVGWSGGNLLWGVEFLLSTLVLSVGLAALSVRFSLHTLERGGGLHQVVLVRAGFLLAGGVYAIALWSRGKASPGEHLLAFFVLGIAFLAMGLNRLGAFPVETLATLGRGRREPGNTGSG
jgi:hypothetical protein